MESYTYFLHNWHAFSVAYTFIHQEVREKQQKAIKHACVRPGHPLIVRPTSGTKHLHLTIFASNNVNTKKGIPNSKGLFG
jgi:hypothetical protein